MSQMNMCSTKDFYDIIIVRCLFQSCKQNIKALSRETTLLHGNKNEEIFLFVLTAPSVHGCSQW